MGTLVAELIEGAKLTGRNQRSYVFPAIKPWKKETAEDVLKKKAVWVQKAIWAQCKASDDAQADREVWSSTKDELGKHWLSGSFDTVEAVSKELGTTEWIPSPRFGLKQGAKVRSIDNYSAGGINGAFSASEKVLLQGVDAVAALGKAMLTATDDSRKVKVTSSSGKEFMGELHPAWALQDARTILGRALDLEAAYRQVALRPSEQWANIILVWNPELKKPQFFFQHALPFGAAASVLLFNRCSCALRALGVACFGLLWCSFFDDFPHLEYARLSDIAKSSSCAMLEVLGWRYSTDPKKDKVFASSFSCLGAEFSLVSTLGSLLSVGNKEGRVASICDMILGCVARGKVTPSEADCMRGRVQYATGQMFDRAGRILVAIFLDGTSAAAARENRVALDQALDLLCCLNESGPRLVARGDPDPAVVVFTDGAFDEFKCTCGAIMFDKHKGVVEHFGFEIERDIVRAWQADGSKQPIALAELLPIVLSKFVWKEKLAGRFVLTFIDNNAVLYQMINGSARNSHSRTLLLHSAKADVANKAFNWYSRVASQSNPGDDPSRLDFEEAIGKFGSTAVQADLHELTRLVCRWKVVDKVNGVKRVNSKRRL